MPSIHNELSVLLRCLAEFPRELKPKIPLYLQKHLQSKKRKIKIKSKWLNQIKTGNDGEGEEWAVKYLLYTFSLEYKEIWANIALGSSTFIYNFISKF